MIKVTLEKIEAAIDSIDAANDKKNAELLVLLKKLKEELSALPLERIDEANSIANFVQAATHEAVRENSDARIRELAREGLGHSAKQFEVSHPVLVGIVNDICRMLAQIGI